MGKGSLYHPVLTQGHTSSGYVRRVEGEGSRVEDTEGKQVKVTEERLLNNPYVVNRNRDAPSRRWTDEDQPNEIEVLRT